MYGLPIVAPNQLTQSMIDKAKFSQQLLNQFIQNLEVELQPSAPKLIQLLGNQAGFFNALANKKPAEEKKESVVSSPSIK